MAGGDAVTGTLQQALHHHAHHLVVVDVQHVLAFAAPLGHALTHRRRRVVVALCQRQQHTENAALAERTFDRDGAAVLGHDAVHHRQAEARAFGGAPRREEGFEDARAGGFVHAHTVVAHPELCAVTGRPRRRRGRAVLGQGDPLQADFDPAHPLPHRERSVGAQVHQHLLDLGGVGVHPQRLLAQMHIDRSAGRQGGAQQRDGFFEHRLQGLNHQVVRLAAAECEDLLHQAARPAARLAHLLEPGLRRVAGFDFLLGQCEVAENGAEDVVEVVRDAAGQCADGLHLVGFAQLRFVPLTFALGAPAVGDVGRLHDKTIDLTGAIFHRGDGGRSDAHFTRRRIEDIFVEQGAVGLRCLLLAPEPVRARLRHVVPPDRFPEQAADDPVGRHGPVAQGELFADLGHTPLRRQDHHELELLVEDTAKALRGELQVGLRLA